MAGKLLNFVIFQVAWGAIVLSAARGWWWAAPACAASALLIAVWMSQRPRAEVLLAIVVTAAGCSIDAVLVASGVVAMQHEAFDGLRTAAWFASLWCAYSTLLNASMSWLKGRVVLGILFGAVGGPLAYLAGQRLGAVSLPMGWKSLATLAGEWAVMAPMCTWCADRFWNRANPRARAITPGGPGP
ncbi:MAG TPA: DUF2878 domain-containing protein [Phycisphaerales bacterium]|nr:DUF2878 domain-containing protein [Phycisphaerales bacterium]